MNNRSLRITILAFIVIASLGVVSYSTAPRVSDEGSSASSVRIISAQIVARGINEERHVAEGTSALTVLTDAVGEHGIPFRTKEYAGMGTLVEKIGDDENGTGGKYWMYYVNGAFALVGADAYVVQEGDVVEWKFELPQSD